MDHRNPQRSAGQVKRLARAYYRRFPTLAASHAVEDLEQELWVVWHRVSQSFDPQMGNSFEAMLGVSFRNKMIELAKFNARRAPVAAGSLDEEICLGDGSRVQLIEALSDPEATSVDEDMERREHAEILLSKMDPRLRTMVEILRDTPEVFQAEIEGLRAKASLAAEMGIRAQIPRRITLSMLTEMFGLSRCSRYRLLDELKEVMEHA